MSRSGDFFLRVLLLSRGLSCSSGASCSSCASSNCGEASSSTTIGRWPNSFNTSSQPPDSPDRSASSTSGARSATVSVSLLIGRPSGIGPWDAGGDSVTWFSPPGSHVFDVSWKRPDLDGVP